MRDFAVIDVFAASVAESLEGFEDRRKKTIRKKTIIINSQVGKEASIEASVLETKFLRPYYRPLDANGEPFDFKSIKPVTLENCIHCGTCAVKCPVQSISHEDHKTILGKCIKCCACVKRCPAEAKKFDDVNFIKHQVELEERCRDRKEPEYKVYRPVSE